MKFLIILKYYNISINVDEISEIKIENSYIIFILKNSHTYSIYYNNYNININTPETIKNDIDSALLIFILNAINDFKNSYETYLIFDEKILEFKLL